MLGRLLARFRWEHVLTIENEMRATGGRPLGALRIVLEQTPTDRRRIRVEGSEGMTPKLISLAEGMTAANMWKTTGVLPSGLLAGRAPWDRLRLIGDDMPDDMTLEVAVADWRDVPHDERERRMGIMKSIFERARHAIEMEAESLGIAVNVRQG